METKIQLLYILGMFPVYCTKPLSSQQDTQQTSVSRPLADASTDKLLHSAIKAFEHNSNPPKSTCTTYKSLD